MSYDRKWIFALAVIGIPGAHGLHGYVGFMFGSLKSREWWSSDLMPVIFLFSAIISGVALLIVLYVLSCKMRKIPVDLGVPEGHGVYAVGLHDVYVGVGRPGIRQIVYKGREGVEMIMEYVTGPLLIPYFILQFGIGADHADCSDIVHDLARHDREGAGRGVTVCAAWCCFRC